MELVLGLWRYLALPPADRRVLLRAFLSLSLVGLTLRVFGFQRVVQRARVPILTHGQMPDVENLRRGRYYARKIDAAARRHVLPARCLHRSLVLHQWLRQEGVPSELRIGVRKDAGAFRAHAWVEIDGQVVNDTGVAVAPFTALVGPVASGSSRRDAHLVGRPRDTVVWSE